MAGIALRFAYPGDIEWKGDERWTFDHAQLIIAGGQWLWLGMNSNVGLPNSGLSLWVFAALFAIFEVRTPLEAARTVQIIEVAPVV